MGRKLISFTAMFLATFATSSCNKHKSNSLANQNTTSQNSKAVKEYNFAVTTTDGKTIKLSDLKGKVVVLDFFGTFCPPCKAEMPFLEKIYKSYDGKVVVLALGVDYTGRPSNLLKPFKEEMHVTFPMASSTENIWNNYALRITGLDSIPQTFILDRNGNVRYYNVGYTPQYDSLFTEAINKLLK